MTENDLEHLPEDKIKELETITERIKETGMVSMIILYGSYARGDWKEHVGGRSGKKSDYDICVLTRDERDCEDLRNRLRKMFEGIATAVDTVVETLGFVNMHLREGQYFFSEIKHQGIVLYQDKQVELANAENLTPKRLREIAELDFKQWFGTSETDFEGFEVFRKRFIETNNHKYAQKAAFELQQCVENCYTAIEIIYSRNNPYEHRLVRLRMNAKRYVPEIDDCFPQNSDDEKFLFWHLDSAYIGGRYITEEHYKVTKEQLDYWEKQAKKLLEITERHCKKRINELKEKELQAGE
ncbi:MAG: HEPN domain-containing protein [Bacteroidales bacterium]|nr:HEPN domain-containing protein [Bacteroidales bacterium]